MGSTFRLFVLLFVAFFSGKICRAQSPGYFQAPLDIPLALSGNFGEIRRTHFHTGLDIKTQGQQGLSVRASADGFVSRIRVSPYGYGNCLYIDHPNGYTTVYAHLSKFDPKIVEFLRKAQQQLEIWEVDLFPGAGQILVKKGEEIGKSGNSGSSGGPHLHFEIRESETEFPVDPLKWGFPITDNIAPRVYDLMVLPLSENATVLQKAEEQTFAIANQSGTASLMRSSPIPVSGAVGLAINAADQLNGQANKCGIASVKVFCNKALIYEQELSKLDFGTKRFVNAHKVYDYFTRDRRRFQRSYILPHNNLDIYKNTKNRGIIETEPGKTYSILYKLTDTYGNQTTLAFDLVGKTPAPFRAPAKANACAQSKQFDFEKENFFYSEDCNLYLPPFALYDEVEFCYSAAKKIPFTLGKTHQVGNLFVPVHEDFTLKLKAPEIAQNLREKLVVVHYNPRRDRTNAKGGKWEAGWVAAEVHTFGRFALMLDTIAPKIQNINFRADMRRRTTANLSLTDDLSGIEKINCYANGKWLPLEFDAKRNSLKIFLNSEEIGRGQQDFKCVVEDERGNVSEFRYSFKY